MEVFFMASYGGAVAVAAIVSMFGIRFFLPIVATLYLVVVTVILLLGYLSNYVFHKIHFFERINQRTVKTP